MNNTKKEIKCKLKNKIVDFIVKITENIGKVPKKFVMDMIFGLLTFVLLAMNFVSSIRDRSEYLTRVLIEQARALNGKVLKYVEHSIIAGISYYLRLSSEGIRTFLKRKISRYYGGCNLCLFDNYRNPYEILGKL